MADNPFGYVLPHPKTAPFTGEVAKPKKSTRKRASKPADEPAAEDES